MASWVASFGVFLALLQAPPPPARAAVSPQTFAGTWVGTQSWALASPPPGARQDQPVSLTIEVVDGKVIGSLTPFLGGQDGATFVDSQIVGDQLQAAAVVGRPRAGAIANEDEGAGARGRRGRPPGWKDPIKIQFAFRNDGQDLKGTADVTLNEIKWLTFNYDLSRKRSRY